jgi:hypothetical protein
MPFVGSLYTNCTRIAYSLSSLPSDLLRLFPNTVTIFSMLLTDSKDLRADGCPFVPRCMFCGDPFDGVPSVL